MTKYASVYIYMSSHLAKNPNYIGFWTSHGLC